MRVKDISKEVNELRGHVMDPNDSWQDYVDWKRIRSEEYEQVSIDGECFDFGKHGLRETAVEREGVNTRDPNHPLNAGYARVE